MLPDGHFKITGRAKEMLIRRLSIAIPGVRAPRQLNFHRTRLNQPFI